ncbi:MAG: orotidine 5'-phosphate decarboxylase, partial [Nitrososphaera sp.]|nr:orotidine 5'-phosphate decarboxylase [Nitrososphaera sp.]
MHRLIPLTAAERLIVAADYKPTQQVDKEEVLLKVLQLAEQLADTGVYLKVNSALRAYGYGLIQEIHNRGLKVFADLKLTDIDETLATDGALLNLWKPELLTIMCSTGTKAMKALKVQLPETEILGVTVLTSLTDEDMRAMFTISDDTDVDAENIVLRLARVGQQAELDGLISSAKEVGALRGEFGALFSLNTPAIRPWWSV